MNHIHRIINCIAVLAIVLALVSALLIGESSLNNYFDHILIILAALAVIVIKQVPKYKWLSNRKYAFDYEHFIDRYEHIQQLMDLMREDKCIVNLFGITGIGVTHTLKFTADLINGRIPLKLRSKYCRPSQLFCTNRIAWYFNVKNIKNLDHMINAVYENMFITTNENSKDIRIQNLIFTINKKAKKKKLLLIFDEIYNKEQLSVIESFILQYFQYRPQDIIFLGSHRKNLSYQLTFKHLEILKFDKRELLILAKAYNVCLREKDSIQLYELSDGIPFFAYLLLRYYDLKKGLCTENLIDYLREEILTSLNKREQEIVVKASLLSLIVDQVPLSQMNLYIHNLSNKELVSLADKGILQIEDNKTKITILKAVAEQAIKLFDDRQFCKILYRFYKESGENELAILYLLFSNIDDHDIDYFLDTIEDFLNSNKMLSLYVALEPSIRMSIDIYTKAPSIYLKYLYSCITMLLSCGEYSNAKDLLKSIHVDGKNVKRIQAPLCQEDFEFYFLWADAEHLLNNYPGSLNILDSLIEITLQEKKLENLCKLYWMKAHCLRHQWKTPEISLKYYMLCENLSNQCGQTEYLIRSIHGQICIAFVMHDNSFSFIRSFQQLNKIYRTHSEKYNIYKYNTFKYKSIYERLKMNKNKALQLLNASIEGYKALKRRNIYDVYFEFGEYFRFFNEFDESSKHYQICVEFAKGNSDYNLQSLAELGLILNKIQSKKRVDEEKMLRDLHQIQKIAYSKELFLNMQYSIIIEEHIKNSSKSSLPLLLFNP